MFAASLSQDQDPVLAQSRLPAVSQAARVRSLIRQLYSSDLDDQQRAIDALVQIGKPAVPFLIRTLKSASEDARQCAVDAIQRIGLRRAPEAEFGYVRALCRQLGAKEIDYRDYAREDLPKLGSKAVPFLLRAARGRNPAAQEGALLALRAMKDREKSKHAPQLVALFSARLASPHPRVRKAAAEALQWRHPAVKSALGALARAARDSNRGVALAALAALSMQ